MDKKERRRFTISIGPLGMSLAAAAVTAVAFAAISLADSGSGGNGGGPDIRTFRARVPDGVGITKFRGPDLSAADKQKMDEFGKCMQDNGAPAPPDPGEFDPNNPPKPPSEADLQKLRQAWEACKDKLPEDMQKAGPPEVHIGGCAPGAPLGSERGKDHSQDQSNDSSGSSSGSTS